MGRAGDGGGETPFAGSLLKAWPDAELRWRTIFGAGQLNKKKTVCTPCRSINSLEQVTGTSSYLQWEDAKRHLWKETSPAILPSRKNRTSRRDPDRHSGVNHLRCDTGRIQSYLVCKQRTSDAHNEAGVCMRRPKAMSAAIAVAKSASTCRNLLLRKKWMGLGCWHKVRWTSRSKAQRWLKATSASFQLYRNWKSLPSSMCWPSSCQGCVEQPIVKFMETFQTHYIVTNLPAKHSREVGRPQLILFPLIF